VHNASTHLSALLHVSELPADLVGLARRAVQPVTMQQAVTPSAKQLLDRWPLPAQLHLCARQRFQPTPQDLRQAGMTEDMQVIRLLRRDTAGVSLPPGIEGEQLGEPQTISGDGIWRVAVHLGGGQLNIYLQVTTAPNPDALVPQRSRTQVTGSLFERDEDTGRLLLLVRLLEQQKPAGIVNRRSSLPVLLARAAAADPTGRTSALLTVLISALPMLAPAHLGMVAYRMPSSEIDKLWREMWAAVDAGRPSVAAAQVLMRARRSQARGGSSADGDATKQAAAIMRSEQRFAPESLGARGTEHTVLGTVTRDNQGLGLFDAQVRRAVADGAINRIDLLEILPDDFFGTHAVRGRDGRVKTVPNRPRHLIDALGLTVPDPTAPPTAAFTTDHPRRTAVGGQRPVRNVGPIER
jgi:hypothetical protein